VALLADLIHNVGDASTAIPLGLAFLFRSARGERWAGSALLDNRYQLPSCSFVSANGPSVTSVSPFRTRT
jgi:hypothetical protein